MFSLLIQNTFVRGSRAYVLHHDFFPAIVVRSTGTPPWITSLQATLGPSSLRGFNALETQLIVQTNVAQLGNWTQLADGKHSL
jgi:hypothetical protein